MKVSYNYKSAEIKVHAFSAWWKIQLATLNNNNTILPSLVRFSSYIS